MKDCITELEIRVALQDDLLDELNRTVALQQQQIEWLARELRRLNDVQQAMQPGRASSPRDEIPPHY